VGKEEQTKKKLQLREQQEQEQERERGLIRGEGDGEVEVQEGRVEVGVERTTTTTAMEKKKKRWATLLLSPLLFPRASSASAERTSATDSPPVGLSALELSRARACANGKNFCTRKREREESKQNETTKIFSLVHFWRRTKKKKKKSSAFLYKTLYSREHLRRGCPLFHSSQSIEHGLSRSPGENEAAAGTRGAAIRPHRVYLFFPFLSFSVSRSPSPISSSIDHLNPPSSPINNRPRPFRSSSPPSSHRSALPKTSDLEEEEQEQEKELREEQARRQRRQQQQQQQLQQQRRQRQRVPTQQRQRRRRSC
jgi:hypothetical protein